MVKRSGLVLLPLVAGLCVAFPAQAAWDFTPLAATRLTWSDNITLAQDDRAESGFVMELSPGFQLSNRSQRFDVDLTYTLRQYKYFGHKPTNSQSRSQDLNGNLKSRLIEDMLFLDAQAQVHQQAVSAFGPQSGGNGYLGDNQNEVRSISISPYLRHRFGAFASGELRYMFDTVSSDNIGYRRSDGNTVRANLVSGPSFRRVGWNASLMRAVYDQEIPGPKGVVEKQSSSTKNANLALSYAATSQLSVGAFAGYDDFDFSGLGGKQGGAAYGANVDWVPSARTSLNASAGHRFYGPSYALGLTHRSRSTSWNVTYNDTVSSSRNQFVLPQALDTAAMLDNLFRSQIADPVMRAAAVQAYIRATGLPPSLSTNINFLSNRYSLQKQLNASFGWQAARSTAVLTLSKARREMLSSQEFDNVLLGNTLTTLNDNTDQVGVTATYSYKLGPRSVASVSGSAVNVESISTDQRSNYRNLRFSLTRSFGARVNGTLEARHVRGTRGLGSDQYTENAVTATLSAKF